MILLENDELRREAGGKGQPGRCQKLSVQGTIRTGLDSSCRNTKNGKKVEAGLGVFRKGLCEHRGQKRAVTARLCPGCNIRRKMSFFNDILSFRSQDSMEGFPEVTVKPQRMRCCRAELSSGILS